jgi:hypothetical protein
VASSCEYDDESSGSGSSATELVSLNYSKMVDVQNSEVWTVELIGQEGIAVF